MNVAGPQLGPQAVSVTRESEQGMKAILSEMTVERHVLLLAVSRIFR
jgi:hypothetical protein